MSFNRSSAFPQIPQNASARETARRLIGLPVPPKFDIAHLRPEHLPPGERFETPADGRARRDAEQERLERSPELTEVADRLLGCSAESPCAEVTCPTCARRFRRWLTGQALRHQSTLDLQMLTVGLELVPTKRLANFDLRVVKRRAAQRVRRAAPSAQFILGGIEADYRQNDEAFLLHAHLLVPRLPRDELIALRSAFADIGVTRALKVQPLRDPPAQISYVLKFTTYHRPGSQKGSRRPNAVPLPDYAFEQLTLWRARYGFLDFVFMLGLRRRGGDLVRTDDKK